MSNSRRFAVLGPLLSGVETRAFLGCELIEGEAAADHPVVVLWLPKEVTEDPAQLARLRRETAFVTELEHKNVIPVFGLECFDEGWARLVGFVDGEPLSRVGELHEGACDPLHAARLILDLCDGVQYAHELGQTRLAGRSIIHGGLRPDTVLVRFDGSACVTGYGASVLAPTGEAAVAAKCFLAPEQVIGGRTSGSVTVDVYAIGALLYYMLAGSPPFSDAEDIDRAVLTVDPTPIEGTGLLAELAKVAVGAMAKRGADRPQTVAALKKQLLDALATEGLAPPSHTGLSALMNRLIPPDAVERLGRKDMLDNAGDPDVMTVLIPASDSADLVSTTRAEAAEPEGSEEAEAPAPAEEPPAPAAEVPAAPAVAAAAAPEAAEEDPLPSAPLKGAAPPPPRKESQPSAWDAARTLTPAAVPPTQPAFDPKKLGAGSSPSAPAAPPPVDRRLQNAPVAGLPPVPPGQLEQSSSISQFDMRAGDNSRYVLLAMFLLLAVGAILIFVMPKLNPPPEEQEAEAPVTKPDPKALVEAAIDDAAKEGDLSKRELAAAAKAETPAAPKVELGRLELSSTPSVLVFIQNKNVGRTPVKLPLPAGKFRVRLTDKKTGINAYRQVRIRAGKTKRVDLKFKTCELTVNAPAGAQITLNRKFLGEAPLEPLKIYEGDYRLRVTYKGSTPWIQDFTAPGGGTLRYDVSVK